MRSRPLILLLVSLFAAPTVHALPSHLWSHSFGGALPDAGYAIAFDPSGNVLVTGSHSGAVDFGGGPLNSNGGEDVFIAKFGAQGVHQWSRSFGRPRNDRGFGVASHRRRT